MFSTRNPFRIHGLIAFAALLTALLQQGAGAQTNPVNIQYGSDFRKVNPSIAALKAVDAMGRQQNFIHAQADGPDAWGYDEKTFVMVHSVALNGGSQIYVVAFSENARDAELARNAIRAFVFDGSFSIGPRVRDNAGSNRVRTPLAVSWTSYDKRCSQNTFRGFARDGIKKDNLQYTGDGNDVAYGRAPGLMVFVIGDQQPQRNTARIMVIGASRNASVAEQHRNEVGSNIKKEILFD